MNDVVEPWVEKEFRDGVAWLTLHNPQRKNAMTLAMAAQMGAICDEINADSTIGVAVLRGEGGYFCSGADTRDLAAASDNPASEEAVSRLSALYNSFVSFGELQVPTIAVADAGAVGAGVNLALAADVLLVSDNTVLDSGFIARGIHPGGGHYSLLGKATGWSQAIAMGVLGQPLRGQHIVSAGLAYACVDDSEIAQTLATLTEVAARDPLLTRKAMNSARLVLSTPGLSWPASLEVERGAQMWSMARKGEAGWKRKTK